MKAELRLNNTNNYKKHTNKQNKQNISFGRFESKEVRMAIESPTKFKSIMSLLPEKNTEDNIAHLDELILQSKDQQGQKALKTLKNIWKSATKQKAQTIKS